MKKYKLASIHYHHRVVKMGMIKKLKTAIATAIMGAALYIGTANAEEPKPVRTEARISIETNRDPTIQGILSYDKHKLFLEGSNNKADIGANIENENFRVNLGYKHLLDKDTGRAEGIAKISEHFLGLEYQLLGTGHRIAMIGGAKISDCFNLEAAVDSEKNASGVAFVDFLGNLFSLGGKTDFNKDWEANISYNKKFPDATLFTYLRLGDSELLDARVMLGPKVSPKKSRGTFSAIDHGYNSVSKTGDVTFPFFLGNFDLTGAETITGDKTGGMGLDVRYTHNSRVYGKVAINAGDYLFVSDVTPSIRFNRNLANNTNTVTLGLRADIPKIGLRIWYEIDINENLKTEHRLYMGIVKEF